MLNYPIVFSLLALFLLVLAAQIGAALHRRRPLKDDERADFGLVQSAALTLLGLIIGFSFAMATGRYDLRKNYEEAEANAIGTEYVRAGLLGPADAAKVCALLRKYLDLRILFYQTRNHMELQKVDAETVQLQSKMWSAVQVPALAHQTPVVGLAVSGMNDVLNSLGYTQAAWWNRIPTSAWGLMIAIAIGGNLLVGYGTRSPQPKAGLLFALPVLVTIAFLLIADIDSPRGGLIHVVPQNLISLSQSLPRQ
ncbi:MAG TPA: hypothetical protein VKB84_09345 [Candidatus Binataceae bacterium]|jgi:hypothetical protein|nr:hypothetical protein [Candidatus Binataceae bacterium]